MTLEVGHELPHHRYLEKLEQGGVGVVWKALETDAISPCPPRHRT